MFSIYIENIYEQCLITFNSKCHLALLNTRQCVLNLHQFTSLVKRGEGKVHVTHFSLYKAVKKAKIMELTRATELLFR